MTATSVVPPPTSTIMLPVGESTGSPAPIAAAIGSDTMKRRLAPAASAESRTARRSTSVIVDGTQTRIVGFTRTRWRSSTCRRNRRSICSAIVKSAMTPSFIGRMARIPSGVRPSIRFASRPTPRMAFVSASTATTDGSSSTTPSPLTRIRVLAVPRSTAIWRAGRHVLRRGGRCGMGSGWSSMAAVTRASLRCRFVAEIRRARVSRGQKSLYSRVRRNGPRSVPPGGRGGQGGQGGRVGCG